MTEKNDVLPSAEKETLDYMRDIANSLGYESVLEALEALDRLKSRPTASADVVEREAERIVAENIKAWKWGPLEEIEGLAEHRLALDACAAGYRAALTASPVQELVERLEEARLFVELVRIHWPAWHDDKEQGGEARDCLTRIDATLAKVRDQSRASEAE